MSDFELVSLLNPPNIIVGNSGILAASLSGNTSGVLALISTGTLYLAGGDNITLSQDGQSVTISGAAGGGGGAAVSFGQSNLGNSSGDTGLVSRRLVLVGGNNVTLSGSINGQSQTITISAFNQSLQTQMTGLTAGFSTLGNTSGDTGLVSRQLVLVGGNNITLSGSVNGQSLSLTISAFNQSVQTQMTGLSAGMSTGGNTAGDTGVVSNRLVFAGMGNISLSQSINGNSATLSISGSQTVQTQMTGLTAGVSTGGNTAGDTGLVSRQLVLVGGNNITLSGSVNGQSATYTISAPNAPAAQTGISGVVVSDATYTSGTVSFSNAGNITISSSVNGATQYIRLSGNSTQSVQTQMTGLSAGMSTQGNTAGDTGMVSNRLVLVGSNMISLSQSINGASATLTLNATQSVQTQMTGLTAGLSNIGNTSGDTGLVSNRLVFAGGNNITLSGSTNGGSMTITISGPNAGGAQTGISSIVVSDTTYTSGMVSFSNQGNVTIGSSVNGVTQYIRLSVASSLTNLMVSGGTTNNLLSAMSFKDTHNVSFGLDASTLTASARINVSAGTTSNDLSKLTFANSNGVSFGLNASTITASILGFQSYFINLDGIPNTSTGQIVSNSSIVQPFRLPYYLSASFLRLPISGSISGSLTNVGTANNATRGMSASTTFFAVIYSLGTGANSQSLQYVTSGQTYINQQITIQMGANGSNWTSGYSVSFPIESGGSSSIGTTGAASSGSLTMNTTQFTNLTGFRHLDMPFEVSLTPGAYWIGYGASFSTSTSGTSNMGTMRLAVNNVFFSQPNVQFNNMGLASASSYLMMFGLGLISTNVQNTTSSLALSNISTVASNPMFWFQLIRQA